MRCPQNPLLYHRVMFFLKDSEELWNIRGRFPKCFTATLWNNSNRIPKVLWSPIARLIFRVRSCLWHDNPMARKSSSHSRTTEFMGLTPSLEFSTSTYKCFRKFLIWHARFGARPRRKCYVSLTLIPSANRRVVNRSRASFYSCFPAKRERAQRVEFYSFRREVHGETGRQGGNASRDPRIQ